MAGVPGMLGVSPRTITEIYDVIEKGKARFNYTVMGSMLELYRQDLVDLLAKGSLVGASGVRLRRHPQGSECARSLGYLSEIA